MNKRKNKSRKRSFSFQIVKRKMIEESWDDHDDVQQQNLNKAFEQVEQIFLFVFFFSSSKFSFLQHNIAPVLGIGRSKPAAAPVVTSMNKIGKSFVSLLFRLDD